MNSYQKQSHNQIYLRIAVFVLAIWFVFTGVYWFAPNELAMKFTNYVQVLTLTILVITGLISVISFMFQNDDRIRSMGVQYAQMTQCTSSDIDRMFLTQPLLDRLYFQIYADDPQIKTIQEMRGPIKITLEMLKIEHQASNLMFQKMGDIYAYENFNEKTDSNDEWIYVFRRWMRSPILRSHWSSLKYEQHPQFRSFVDNIIINFPKK